MVVDPLVIDIDEVAGSVEENSTRCTNPPSSRQLVGLGVGITGAECEDWNL